MARVAQADKAPILGLSLAARLVLPLALCCVLGMAGGTVRAEPILAFVSVLPLKYFVERVGGEHVRVAVMVGPGQSPHTFEPSPKQMAAITEAQVYFRIGIPFEDVWLERIAATNPTLRIEDVRKSIPHRTFELETATHQRSHPEEEKKLDRAGPSDPHIWTDPRRVKIIAENIREVLSALDPAHRPEYESNCAEFANELDRLDQTIRQLLASKTARQFMVFHPAWSYFAEAYGLEQISIEMAGKVPGAKQLAQLIDEVRALGIRVIFAQVQFSQRNAKTVAQALGARVIALDPLAENYSENLLLVAKTIAETME
jgi:zinc transport system substrate-binding protein